jgi:CheY-like chemotaxis protein
MTTWMVVEDEPDLYELVLAMYETLGVDGVSFTNGEDAIAWIEDVENGLYPGELPELALIDIRLPGKVDGPMVGGRLRKSPLLEHIGIVLMTAYRLSPKQEQDYINKSKCNTLLYKPLPMLDEFAHVMNVVLGRG